MVTRRVSSGGTASRGPLVPGPKTCGLVWGPYPGWTRR